MKTLEDRLIHFGQRLYEASIPCAILMVKGNRFTRYANRFKS